MLDAFFLLCCQLPLRLKPCIHGVQVYRPRQRIQGTAPRNATFRGVKFTAALHHVVDVLVYQVLQHHVGYLRSDLRHQQALVDMLVVALHIRATDPGVAVGLHGLRHALH